MAGNSQNFTIIISALDRASATVRAINMRIDALKAPFAGVSAAAARFSDAARLPQFAKGLENVGQKFGNMVEQAKSALGPLAAIGAMATAGGLLEMAHGAAEYGAQLYLGSIKTGVAVEQMGALHYAAQQSGASAEQLDKGLERLNRTTGQVLMGKNKEMASMFRHVGISLKDAHGHVRSTADVFGDLSEAVKKYANNRPALEEIAKSMGMRGGDELLAVMIRGKKGLQEYREEFDKLHGPMTKAAALADHQMAEGFGRLKLAASGVRDAVGTALAPTITKLITPLTNWLAANRQLIASKVGEWAKQFGNTLSKINWGDVASKVLGVARAIGGVAKFLGPTGIAIAAIGLKFGGLIKSILGFGGSLIKLAIANPLLAGILVAVSLLAIAGYEIYTHWSQITAFFSGLWKRTVELFKWAYNNILPWLPGGLLVMGIVSHWSQIVAFFKKLWGDVVGVFEWAWNKIKPIIEPIIEAAEWVGQHVAKGLSTALATPGHIGATVNHKVAHAIAKASIPHNAAASPTAPAPRLPSASPVSGGARQIVQSISPREVIVKVMKGLLDVNVDVRAPQGTMVRARPSNGGPIDKLNLGVAWEVP
jgi:hypothetical protein